MQSTPATRRQVLKATASGVGTAAIAGCTVLSGGGSEQALGSATDWVYDPGTDAAEMQFRVTKYQALLDASDVTEERFGGDAFGVDMESIARETEISIDYDTAVQVDEGSFDADVVRSTAESERFEPADQYRGYDRYDDGQFGGHLAVDDGALLYGKRDAVERAIDATNGDADRLVDRADDVDRVLERLDTTHLYSCSSRRDSSADAVRLWDDEVARGESHRVDGDRTTVTEVTVFFDADDAHRERIEERTPDNRWVEDEEIEVDGRIVAGTYEAPTNEIL